MKKEKKSVLFQFRVTPTEAQRISKWVEESGLTLPDYLRRVVMKGVVFRVEINAPPEKIYVESAKFENPEETEVQPKRRHAAG